MLRPQYVVGLVRKHNVCLSIFMLLFSFADIMSVIEKSVYERTFCCQQVLLTAKVRMKLWMCVVYLQFSLCFYFLRLGQKENECLLVTIKTDGCGTVIVKPDFNKGKEPYRQVHKMSGDCIAPVLTVSYQKQLYDLLQLCFLVILVTKIPTLWIWMDYYGRDAYYFWSN